MYINPPTVDYNNFHNHIFAFNQVINNTYLDVAEPS